MSDRVRICQICGTDIEDKRKDAQTCGSTCRADKSRLEAEGKPLPYASGYRGPARPRAGRAGVEIYLTDDEAAALLVSPNGNEVKAQIAEKVRRALDRKRVPSVR